ncbi:kazrin isoform X3 [Nematostella vectensis]|uniref:kazrin isoform X3 n=1 Tax=Nematostella vectensis TaxID=45351 RepID=UPI00138FDE4F|nr:kazrin isoform X3 [Nematostella vectensis]
MADGSEPVDLKDAVSTGSRNSLSTAEAREKLDSLNEKVRSFSLSVASREESSEGGSARLVRKQDDLIACLSVMRRLMEQAEHESKRLKEEKFMIAAKINNSLNSVNREVEHLKAELQDQDKRLAELASGRERVPHRSESTSCSNLPSTVFDSCENTEDTGPKLGDMTIENQRLRQENEFLSKELDEFKERNTNLTELLERLHCCEHEISRAKETIVCMKAERKKLKSEKMELLSQMKQVYAILEDKESELGEFIKNYQQHMRESEIKIQRLLSEKESWERERKNSLQYLDDMNTQLRTKESQLAVVESELLEVKQHLTLLRLNAPSRESNSSQAADSNLIRNNLNTSSGSSRFSRAIQADVEKLLHSREKYEEMVPSPYSTTERLSASPVPTPPGSDTQSESSQIDQLATLSPEEREVFEYVTPVLNNVEEKKSRKKDKRGSLSRLFSKGRNRKSVTKQTYEDEIEQYILGTSYSSKQHIFEAHKDVPMACWKANMVLAWLEVECHMPMYAQMCYENVKSGRVLLDLSDAELESGLGISNVMHRRKLRLAIEEYRDPSSVKYPYMSKIDHFWVARTWIRDLGLSQYGPAFESQMIDGRLLNVLTRKDMEKHLHISKKFHQTSILNGVDLLRLIAFDKQCLIDRRLSCDETDIDPVVWTNDKVMRWCRSIDLQEYADNLRDSGVHGAMMVINETFGPDEMANCLAIHPSKNIIRRHLTSEMTALITSARGALDLSSIDRKDKKDKSRRRSMSFNVGQRSSTPTDSTKRHSFRHLNNRGLSPVLPVKSGSTSLLQVPNNAETPRTWIRPIRPRSSVQ